MAFDALERGAGRGLARLGGGQSGDGAVTVGGRLLETLLRAEIGLRELIGAVIFERGPLDLGLGALLLRRSARHLRLRLGDDRALGVDLAREAGDGRVLGADAPARGVDGVPIVAVVDRGQKIALVDDLVVDHRNLSEVAHRLGGDDRGVGADIGVVGRDQETPLDEIVIGRLAAIAERGEKQDRNNEPAQAGPLGRGGLARQRAGPREHARACRKSLPQGRGIQPPAGAVIARDAVPASGPATLDSSTI